MRISAKKILYVVLMFVFAMSLCACKADPNCGTYICKNVEVENISVDGKEAFINGAEIQLLKAGECKVILDGVEYKASWTRKDNDVTIDLQETPSTGKLEGNKLIIDLFGFGMNLTFEKQ